MRHKFIRKALCLFVFFTLSSLNLSAQELVQTYKAQINSLPEVQEMLILNNGKKLVAGNVSFVGTEPVQEIFMLDESGNLDLTFQLSHQLSGKVHQLLEVENGKIIVAGQFTYGDYHSMIRLNSDGSLDDGFLLSSELEQVLEVDQLSNGKLIVRSFSFNKNIARLNEDGSLDTIFELGNLDSNGYASNQVAIQSDGKIIIAGSFTAYNDIAVGRILRLNTDGTIDNTYNVGDAFTQGYQKVESIELQEDGKLLVAGQLEEFDGNVVADVIRLNQDGTLDTFFEASHFALNTFENGSVSMVAITPDNKILVGGLSFNNNELSSKIFKMNQDGSLVAEFPVPTFSVYSVEATIDPVYFTVDDSGQVYSFGNFSHVNEQKIMGVAHFDTAGNLDTTFSLDPGASPQIFDGVKQPNGQLILGGEFFKVNGKEVKGITRINSDGSLDELFHQNVGKGFDGTVKAIALQEDGKILVAGIFKSFNSQAVGLLLRLNSDGTVDQVFNSELNHTFSNYGLNFIYLDEEGNIYTGGDNGIMNGEGFILNQEVIKLNPDGSLNQEFDGDLTAERVEVNEIKRQSDGQFIVAGRIDSSPYDPVLVRLDINGVVDESFQAPTLSSFMETRGVEILSDDRILVFGTSAFQSSDYSVQVYQLGKDGALVDEIYYSVESGNSFINSVLALDEDYIVSGGKFKLENDSNANNLKFSSFKPGVDIPFMFSSNGAVNCLEKIDEHHILVAGNFSVLNNEEGYSGIAVLDARVPLTPEIMKGEFDITPQVDIEWKDNSFNEEGFEIWRAVNESASFELIDSVGADQVTFVDQNVYFDSVYTYQVRAYSASIGSGFSANVSVKPEINLAAPEQITVRYREEQVSLNWVDTEENEEGFLLYRAVGDNSNFVLLDSLEANTVTYVDSSVETDLHYYYKIKSYRSTVTSEFSAEIEVSTLILSATAELNDEIYFYPNPTDGTLFVELPDLTEQANIHVMDSKGKQLLCFTVSAQKASVHQLNIKELKSGIYFIKMNSEKGASTYKIFKR